MKKKLIRITTVPTSLNVLLKGQLQFMNQYYDVIAVSSGGNEFEQVLEQEKVKGHVVNMSRQITPLKDLKALILLIILFIKEKPYIVHTHTPKAGTLGMLAAFICRVPHRLHTVAGLPLLEAKGKKRKLLDFVEKITYACANKVYPNSFELEKIILDNHYTNARKLKVIAKGSSNGIDTKYFSQQEVLLSDTQVLRQELHMNEDDFVFCFVGRIVRDKGIEELINAFQRVSEESSNVKLILVGEYEKTLDPISANIEEIIQNHPHIHFVGFKKDIRPYLAISDIFTFPSYREGFPNVVMQAGAMGLSSIVTNINGCNEIIIEGKNGWIIPVKDENTLYKTMLFAIQNKETVNIMASNAREMITSRYEREYVWNSLLKEYQSLEK